jgi:hypothetical protein
MDQEHLSRLHPRGYTRHDAYPGNVVTLRVMVDAYTAALQRYKDATGGLQSATLAYAPLAEALNHAVSIDDRVRKDWAPEGKPLGWNWRAKVPEAEILRGIQFVRNRVHHQWADAIVFQGSVPYENLPMARITTTWREADKLPPGDPEHPDTYGGEQVYEDRLAGKLVRDSLGALSDVFEAVAGRIEADQASSTDT